jgi:hypothetical protein
LGKKDDHLPKSHSQNPDFASNFAQAKSQANTEIEIEDENKEDMSGNCNNNAEDAEGNGKVADDTPKPSKEKTWRDSFEIYLNDLRVAYGKAIRDREWIAERQKYHPGLNILLSLEKACKDYWSTEAGWKKKKAGKTAKTDWVRTFNNALTVSGNKVWETKEKNDGREKQKEIIVIQS